MKVTVEIDIAPEEIPLATELFKTIRHLSEQVKLKSPSPAHFKEVILRCADPSQLDSAAADVITILGPAAFPREAQGQITEAQASEQAEKLKFLSDALLEVVMNPSLHPSVSGRKTVLPFLHLIPKLPAHAQSEVAQICKKEVTRQLMERRPIGAPRASVYHLADAFAGLLSLDKINVAGMFVLVSKLLSKGEEYQMGVVTTLGRAVEICNAKILEQADPAKLSELSSLLSKVHKDFRYDANYICNALGLSPPFPHDADVSKGSIRESPPPVAQVLYPSQSFATSEKICALVWDDVDGNIISTHGDGTISVRDLEGTVQQEIRLGSSLLPVMDIMPNSRTLFTYATRSDTGESHLIRFSETKGKWKESGRLSRHMVTCIRALGKDQKCGIAVAESDINGKEGNICLYDTNRDKAFGGKEPLRLFSEHQQKVSCLAASRSDPNVFISGSLDNTIRVFDRRVASSVATLNSLGVGGFPESGITAIDTANGAYFVSGSFEAHGQQGAVKLWDWRYNNQSGTPVSLLHTLSPVVTVAAGTDISKIAFSTFVPQSWLYSVNFSSGQPGAEFIPNAVPASPFENGRGPGTYNALKWGIDLGTLFAGGDACRIDSYVLT